MYGWLSSDDTHRAGEITVLIPNWEPMTATTLTEAQRKARLGKLMPFVQLALAQDSGRTRDRLFFALRETIVLPPDELVEFALHMRVAHERLPDQERAEREAVIAKILDSYFAGIPQPGTRLAQLLGITRQIALLIPDALLDTRLRSICTQIRSDILSDPVTQPPDYVGILRFIPELANLCRRSGNPRHEPMCGELVNLPSAQAARLTSNRLAPMAMSTPPNTRFCARRARAVASQRCARDARNA